MCFHLKRFNISSLFAERTLNGLLLLLLAPSQPLHIAHALIHDGCSRLQKMETKSEKKKKFNHRMSARETRKFPFNVMCGVCVGAVFVDANGVRGRIERANDCEFYSMKCYTVITFNCHLAQCYWALGTASA